MKNITEEEFIDLLLRIPPRYLIRVGDGDFEINFQDESSSIKYYVNISVNEYDQTQVRVSDPISHSTFRVGPWLYKSILESYNKVTSLTREENKQQLVNKIGDIIKRALPKIEGE